MNLQEYDREIERTKKEWSSGKEGGDGSYFDPRTQTYWDSKKLYDKRPKHLYLTSTLHEFIFFVRECE